MRSKTLGSDVLGQYSVSSSVGEIQDFKVRCTRPVSIRSVVGEIHHLRVRCTRSVFDQ